MTTDELSFEIGRVERLMVDLTCAGKGDVAEAAAFHLGSGGSRVRCRLALHAGTRLGLGLETRLHVAAACELLHNASLIHDDLQDGDAVRRGHEAVWIRFGRDTALLTGDLFISAAYGAIAKLNSTQLPHLINRMHTAVSVAIRGQALDLHANKQEELSLAQYETIAAQKSGALLCLPLEMCFLTADLTGSVECARSAVNEFALAYQMTDDIGDQLVDAANGRPNIVSILNVTGKTRDARDTALAADLAQAHLDRAIEMAAELPAGSGQLLIDYAQKLRASLPTQVAA